jgi:hypothetical protein
MGTVEGKRAADVSISDPQLRLWLFCDEATGHGETAMDQRELSTIAANLIAIKFLLVEVAKIAFLNAGIQPEHVRTMRENARAMLSAETFPTLGPALSDHLAAEIEEVATEILSRVETRVADPYGSSHR